MAETTGQQHSALTHILVLGRVLYTTCGNWLVGLTPEENHWAKGYAWTRIGAYRWAAWHFRKYLTYSDLLPDFAPLRMRASGQLPG